MLIIGDTVIKIPGMNSEEGRLVCVDDGRGFSP